MADIPDIPEPGHVTVEESKETVIAKKPLCGGFGNVRGADPDVQALVDAAHVRARVETELGTPPSEYKAISYKTQVVAGTNYDVKISVGGGACVHIRVFKPLGDRESQVNFVKTGMTMDSEL